MGLASIIGEAGEALLESRMASTLSPEVLERDSAFLRGLGELNTPELTGEISKYLINEGRPGSAEYMIVFSRSATLDKELELIEAGVLDIRKAEQLGLLLMVDFRNTTPEMIKVGQAILTREAREDFLGAMNSLRYKLDRHIGRTVQKASEYFSVELTRGKNIAERLREVLGIAHEPYEIPFDPTEAELERLNELTRQRYMSGEEARQKFQRELYSMMKQRPGIVGLETTASASIFIKELGEDLSDRTKNAVDIGRLRNLHEHMKVQGMNELQIYPEFGKAVEESIERDFSQLY